MSHPIDQAINDRVEIEFVYDGLFRIVQPCAHGVHRTTSNVFLRGYQVGGDSSSRVPPLWDMFLDEKIEQLVITDRVFADNPPRYTPGDKHMATIYAEL